MQLPGMPMGMGFPMMPVTAQQPKALNLMMAQLFTGPKLTQPGIHTPMSLPAESVVGETFTPSRTPARGQTADGAQSPVLIRAEAFSQMTEGDLASTLTGMKLPVNKENVALARGMLENGLTLNSETFREMNETLTQLPSRLPSDMQSASFLKLSSLPMTTHNVTLLSNFITTHPLIGAQLFEVQFEFRKISGAKEKVSKEMMDMLSKVPGLLGEYILDGKNNTKKKNSQSFQNMATQVGIEKLPPGWWQDDEMDLMKMLIAMRSKLGQEGMDEEESVIQKLIKLLAQIEENITAQQLINTARKNDETAFYYMQVPMRLDGRETTAELRIYYTTDYQENKSIEDDNTTIEFLLSTEHLGSLHFHLEINHGIINMDVGTMNEEVRAFVEKYLPALQENITHLAYTPGRAKSYVMTESQCTPQLIEVQEFEKLERVNLEF